MPRCFFCWAGPYSGQLATVFSSRWDALAQQRGDCLIHNQPLTRLCRASTAISQSHLQRQFNELILVRVAAFGEGLEDLREKKEL